MKKDEYAKKRDMLLKEAESLVNKGDLEAFASKKAEIEKFDADFEAAAVAAASLKAMTDNPVAQSIDKTFNTAAAAAPLAAPIATLEVTEENAIMDPADITNSADYRRAFMNRVMNGTPMPTKFSNVDENTLTTDVPTVIPTVLVNRIIEKMESIGMILPLVTHTSFRAGINIPTSKIRPVATWVGEGEGSDRQKKTTDKIVFTNHKLRCEISVSMEVDTMAISAFEATFVKQVSEAMVKAIETKIISKDAGTNSPRGILAETPPAGQALTANELNYKFLTDAEAALPQAYEANAVWCMTKKTFMGLQAMVDTAGQPIARTNYGIAGKSDRTLLGRNVVLCGDYMDSFSETLAAGKIFAFLFNFSDYAMNTVYDMGIQRKQDWDTEDMLTKAVMSIDGKVTDENSLVTIAKKA